MKARKGFVSNSSSSSFVVRGIRLPINEAILRLGVDPDRTDLWEAIVEAIDYAESGDLTVESTASFFESESLNTADVILGEEITHLNDGCVIELPDPDDTTIRAKIEVKLSSGIGRLKTYVQYISNDNF